MNKKNKKVLFAGALAMSLGMTSCLDNSWDLSEDNIDLTVGSEIDLTLPGSSTGTIQLKNIIDLEDDGVVQLAKNPKGGDSIYVVCETGEADIDPFTIETISFDSPSDEFYNDIPLRKAIFDLPAKVKAKAPKKGEIYIAEINTTVYYDHLTKNYDFGKDKTHQNLHQKAGNITDDVVSIKSVQLDKDMTVKINLEVSGLPAYLNTVHLDNLVFSFTKKLNITECKLQNSPCEINKQNGTIILTKVADEGSKDNGYNITNGKLNLNLELKIDKQVNFADFKSEADYKANGAEDVFAFWKEEKNGIAAINADFDITGSFRIETSEMDNKELEKKVREYITEKLSDMAWLNGIKENKNISLNDIKNLIPTEIPFKGSVNVNDGHSIIIDKVSGNFKHAIGKIDPIKLDDLPDFLNDDEVVLDLDNPMLFINTSTTLPVIANTAITLTSKLPDNQTVVRKTDLTLNSGKMTYWVANRDDNTYMPEEYLAKDKKYITIKDENNEVAKLTELISKVPEEIVVDVDTVVLEADDLPIGKEHEYKVDVDYQIYAPLAFGEKFKLVYQGTESDLDLGEDFDDIDLGTLSLEINADIVSTLPAGFNLLVEPLDKNGNLLKTLEPVSIKVAAATNGSKKSPITLALKPTKGHVLNESLNEKWNGNLNPNKLDGIHYRAEIDGKDGEVLTGAGSIKLENIKIHIKGKVSFDANDN